MHIETYCSGPGFIKKNLKQLMWTLGELNFILRPNSRRLRLADGMPESCQEPTQGALVELQLPRWPNINKLVSA